MDTRLKFGMGALVLFALLYRLVFNDSIASNYEVPPGYSAPKSIAQIEAQEQKAFELAMAEALPQVTNVKEVKLEPVKPPKVKSFKVATKKLARRKLAKLVSLKAIAPNRVLKRKLPKL